MSALGGLLFGYDLVVIGGAKEFYELVYNLSTPAIQGWAVSSCIVGCIIGAMGVGKPSDVFGRKKLLIVSALMFFVSALGSGYAPTFTQFVLYRLLGGIGMGIASTLSPMYISEISPAPPSRSICLSQPDDNRNRYFAGSAGQLSYSSVAPGTGRCRRCGIA